MNTIEVKNIQVSYDKTEIIHDISLQIKENEITTIIGPNGCGKSTLLKAITRIIPFSKGTVLLDGESIVKMNTKELAKRLAILPQMMDHPNGLTVGELVSYGRFPHQRGFNSLTQEDYEMVDWALEMTHTSELKYRDVDTLSGGQRQRVWIAMALAQKTDIIFLDEPTTYLDLAHQLEVLNVLKHLNETQACTIVMVLHDLNHAARFSHNLIALRDGQLIKHGKVEEVMQKEILKEIFQIDAEIVKDPRHHNPVCLTYDLL